METAFEGPLSIVLLMVLFMPPAWLAVSYLSAAVLRHYVLLARSKSDWGLLPSLRSPAS